MTDKEKKEILKQINDSEKIKPYAVDTVSIRRGKANLVLMMTLTTADHYDWFTGKFPSHNYFEFCGYRVYRRNVCQPAVTIPQQEISRLKTVNNELVRIYQSHIYQKAWTDKDAQRELIDNVNRLTPLLLASVANLAQKQMHYIGEICDADDILLSDVDLVKIYSIANACSDEDDALEKIYADFKIPENYFDPVKIDERTNWGMVLCPQSEFFTKSFTAPQRILFQDQQRVLGEIRINDKSKLLTPHTQWTKAIHEHHGADITIPFAKPYPLWNLPAIQERKNRVVLLTDNLILAYKKQGEIDKIVQGLISEEYALHDRSALYMKKNDLNSEFEKSLYDEVQRRTREFKQIFDDERFELEYNRNFNAQNLAWILARLLYLYEPHFLTDPYTQTPVREKMNTLTLESTLGMIWNEITRTTTTVEKIFSDTTHLNFNFSRENMQDYGYLFEKLPAAFQSYCVAIFQTLCDVIEDFKKEDQEQFQKIQAKHRTAQKVCWSSWFGGNEALADVNWRELRKRDVVYVLTDLDEHSYRTALTAYERIKRICNSIHFAVKNKIVSEEDFIASAQETFGLSLENLKIKVEPVSMFEIFDPRAALPKRLDFIIDPIISERSITLMYAPTGVGKTWFAMCIALAASHGKGLFSNSHNSWNARKPRRVVYLDSEMSEYNFKKRLQVLNQMYESENQNLSFKLVAGENFNLTDETKGYCDQITQWLNDEAVAGKPVDLLILDNLTTLTGFNDSAKSWEILFSWMKALKEKRHHPCSILVVHHSNKKGDQRGTSTKTATVDNVIKLDKQESVSKDSLRYSVTIEKGRDMESIPPPFSVELQLPSRSNAKPVFRAVNINKDETTRTTEAIQYLKKEKDIPHKVIAALTGLTPEYVRQLSFRIKSESKKTTSKEEED